MADAATKKWKFTMPDGTEYIVPADTAEIAQKALPQVVQNSLQEEFTNAPWYSKALQSFDDQARIMGNAATIGSADRIASVLPGSKGFESEKFLTDSAKARQGGFGTAGELLGYLALGRMMPSAVGPATTAVGGGPVIRALTGTGTAALESAALSGTESTMQGEDPLEGIKSGLVFGPAGHAASKAVTKTLAGGKKVLQQLGVLNRDMVPEVVEELKPKRKPGRPSKATLQKEAEDAAAKAEVAKARSKAQGILTSKVNAAKMQAKSAEGAGFDRAISGQFKNILLNPEARKSFSPEVLEAMDRVVGGDFAVKVGRKVGKIPGWLQTAGAVGTGGPVGAIVGPMEGVLAGLGAGSAMASIGAAGRRTANQGAKRLTKEVQDMVEGTYKPPTPPPGVGKDVYNLIRMLGMS